MGILDMLLSGNRDNRRNYIIFNIVLNGAGLLLLLYNVIFQCATCYVTVYLFGGVAGLIIETVGTKLNLWQYYNREKPPGIAFFIWASAFTIITWLMNVLRLI